MTLEVSRDDVQLDSGIGSRLERMVKGTRKNRSGSSWSSRWARMGSTTLVEEIRKLGLRAEPAAMASPGAGPTLSIEGQILSITEGNKTPSADHRLRRRGQRGEDAHAGLRGNRWGGTASLKTSTRRRKARGSPVSAPWAGAEAAAGRGGPRALLCRVDWSRERALPDRRGRHPARSPGDRERAREVLRRAALDHPGPGQQTFLGPLASSPSQPVSFPPAIKASERI